VITYFITDNSHFYRVLKIESSLKDLDYEYLLNAYDLEKDSFIIKTTHLDHLAKLLLSKNRICIHGPKGVGKSFSLVYLMCQDSSKTFVLLSPDINYKETLKYLQALNKEDSKFNGQMGQMHYCGNITWGALT